MRVGKLTLCLVFDDLDEFFLCLGLILTYYTLYIVQFTNKINADH